MAGGLSPPRTPPFPSAFGLSACWETGKGREGSIDGRETGKGREGSIDGRETGKGRKGSIDGRETGPLTLDGPPEGCLGV